MNSLRRLRLAAQDGYDSVDGTYLAYEPDKNLPRPTSGLEAAGILTTVDALDVSPKGYRGAHDAV